MISSIVSYKGNQLLKLKQQESVMAMKLSVTGSEQGKKPSIFSSSILLRPNSITWFLLFSLIFTEENLECDVSGATENSNQESQRDHKSFFASRNSHYRKPMTPGASTKPKNIFSKHLVDNSLKYRCPSFKRD